MNRKVIFTLTILAIVYWFLFDHLRWDIFDSPSFIGASRLLFGLEGGFDYQSRITKPLVLFLPGILELLTGLQPKYTFLFQNVVCFYLCGIYVFKIGNIIFKDEKKAYLGMLAYTTCQSFAIFSLFILSDVVGWFFGILSIYLVLKHFSKQDLKITTALAIGMLIGLGCVAKESAVIGLLFLVSYLLVSGFPLVKKATYLISSFLGFAVPLCVSYLFISYFYDDSIIGRIVHTHNSSVTDDTNLLNIEQLFRVLDMYWFLFAVGLFAIVKSIRAQTSSHMIKAVFLAITFYFILMGGYALLVTAPLYFVDRILFTAAPLLIIIIIAGIDLFKQFAFPLILLGGLFNILISYAIYKFDLHGAIRVGAMIYVGLMAISILYMNKEWIMGARSR